MIRSEKGMTVFELLIASTISVMLLGMGLAATMANRNSYSYDILRTRLNQNIRNTFDIINSELRQAGERLPSSFPAIEIINGSGSNSDEIILKRNLKDEVLTVCQTLTQGSTASNVYITKTGAGTPPACVYGTQTANYSAWKTYRQSKTSPIDAFIFDFATKKGEYFKYDTESDVANTSQSIHRLSGSWLNSYTGTGASAYILNTWHFKMSQTAGQTDLLQLVENEDTSNPKNVSYGIDNIQFKVIMQDDTEKTSFTASDSWTQIKAIEVSVTASDTYRGRTITSTLSTQLFPRNVLSN